MSKLILTSAAGALLAFAWGMTLVPASSGCSAPTSDEPTSASRAEAEGESLGRVSLALEAGAEGGAGLPIARGALVISQVYGGGGDDGDATFNRDFVELYNKSNATVSLEGLALQVAGATADFGANVVELDGSIPAGGYYLVAFGTGTAGGPALPAAADQTSAIKLDPTAYKVALAGTTALTCGGATRCAKDKVLDIVGYGAVTDFEGTQSVVPLDSTHAAMRKGKGCTDADDNRADFTSETPAPRTSATEAYACPPPPTPPPKDAGPPPPPVKDPELPDEVPFDAGAPRADAGGSNAGGGGEADSCAVSLVGESGGTGVMALGVAAVALAMSARRRRRR